jgi:hypothetical protein
VFQGQRISLPVASRNWSMVVARRSEGAAQDVTDRATIEPSLKASNDRANANAEAAV